MERKLIMTEQLILVAKERSDLGILVPEKNNRSHIPKWIIRLISFCAIRRGRKYLWPLWSTPPPEESSMNPTPESNIG